MIQSVKWLNVAKVDVLIKIILLHPLFDLGVLMLNYLKKHCVELIRICFHTLNILSLDMLLLVHNNQKLKAVCFH